MSLETRIMEDLKEAMKAKDQAAMRGIRAIKSAILLFKTDGSGNELDEANEIKLLQRLVKQRQDSLDIYTQQNRADLAQVEKEEIAVIMRYLPKQLEGEELEAVIRGIISSVGASSVKDMGKVMGAANQQLAGKADGKSISEVVKKLLAS
ncbi:MAG: GatB/YqeY domain-containing protein [Saprospiraceae bacterium]|nr:GatB/YqeY domain-containing protein [Saprospiraceae bacterium]MBK7787831.1 GatB/YqeY domain-containing protein [Saprospiraceae bacterium]MBK8849996.1 GatB/YqeY domain-containing protein [Saprospiraceae bacterium]MBK9686867.1 GatB/YqeY domain-containing protein [Saprospiraceae bacterium]MBL0081633.1 GatB/YqeY domain-containing protein [Saprospiraceae bacterium]